MSADLGVLEAAALLRGGQLSAGELTEACLHAIEERNGGPPSFEGAPDAINGNVLARFELPFMEASIRLHDVVYGAGLRQDGVGPVPDCIAEQDLT